MLVIIIIRVGINRRFIAYNSLSSVPPSPPAGIGLFFFFPRLRGYLATHGGQIRRKETNPVTVALQRSLSPFFSFFLFNPSIRDMNRGSRDVNLLKTILRDRLRIDEHAIRSVSTIDTWTRENNYGEYADAAFLWDFAEIGRSLRSSASRSENSFDRLFHPHRQIARALSN